MAWPMTAGRQEIPPSEQLWALRHARDRYQALAERLKDDPDFEGSSEERRVRESEARRIAGAYEKSVANMVASCRVRHVDLQPSVWGNAGMRFAILAFLVAMAGGAAYVLLLHPELPRIRILFEPSGRARMLQKEMEGKIAIPVPPSSQPQAAALPALPPMQIVPAIRPTPRPETSRSPVTPDPYGGFVAKVLHPDGSLRDEYFKALSAR
jgi:hypothetical protein